MAFGSWEAILDEYQSLIGGQYILRQDYAEHIAAMVELINLIREHEAFTDVIPGTSLITLFMGIPKNAKVVKVWYSQEKGYQVYLYHPDEADKASVYVNREQILETLVEYLHKLRTE
jgi:hypothetical protein